MITLVWWQAIAALFLVGGACFALGVGLMAAFVMAGRADDDMEAAADPRLRVDVGALPAWQREAIGGDE